MLEKLKKFIKDNDLRFMNGSRNLPIVVLVGYGLYIGATQNEVKLATEQAEHNNDKVRTSNETVRVYDYAEENNYIDYWKTDEAKKEWIF